MVKSKHIVLLFLLATAFTLFLDQGTKWLIQYVQPSWTFSVISIHLTTNTGAGFGILQGQTILLGIISLFVGILVVAYYSKIPKYWLPQVLMGLFLGGVLGNLIDRLFRGHVIDFMDISFWPSFNVADLAITVSAIGLIIYFWKT
ncbi:MAG: signal peptidase II [Nanoarchaeota archaeon]